MSKPSFGLTQDQRARVLIGPKRSAMALQILLYAAKQRHGVTADECTNALGFTHQSSSARFHELVKSGCLSKTAKKRRTKTGASAVVHLITPDAKFVFYLAFIRLRVSRAPLREQALDQAMAFMRGWARAKTKTKKQRLIATLVGRLGFLSKELST